MKNFTMIKSTVLVTLLLCISTYLTKAATYTVIKSGSYTNAGIWKDGLMPPAMLTNGDNIIIPQNFTVSSTSKLELSAGATMSIDGSYISTGGVGSYISLGANSMLIGTGIIDVDSIYIEQKAPMTFAGDIMTQKLTVRHMNVGTPMNISVGSMLHIMDTSMIMNSGTLAIDSNATIVRDGGWLMISGTATFTNADVYNLEYRGPSMTTDIEVDPVWIKDFTVALDTGNVLTVDDTLSISGTMTLTNGDMAMGNKTLRFTSSSDFSSAGTGTITTTPQTTIEIYAANSFSGDVRFTTKTAKLNTLKMKALGSGVMISMYHNIEIYNELLLDVGVLDIYDYTLTMISGSKLNGGSAGSYILTDNGGMLQMEMTANNATIYPVGTRDGYAPASITTNNLGTNNILVGAMDDVRDEGLLGNSIAATQPVVDATWFIESEIQTGFDIDATFMWDASMEKNGFNRSNVYVSHYTNGMWDTDAMNAAGTSGSMYTATRTNITSLSPFAVFEGNTKVSVENIVDNSAELNIYPNPAMNELNINYATNGENVQVNIYSLSGQLVKAATINGSATTVNVSDLTSGVYYIRLNGEGTTATQKFVKQ